MTHLYSWGANSNGQLGLGYSCEKIAVPTRVDDLPDNLTESAINSICGGGAHSLILTNQGTLFGAGMNSYGQVGNGTNEKAVKCFQEIRGLEGQKIIQVVCGWAHSVALTDHGIIYVWGSNSHSQLGLPTNEVPFSCLPISLALKDVICIAAGLRHTVAITKNGYVYAWGQGHRGQLGHIDEHGRGVKRQSSPKLVMMEPQVKFVACGENTTYALTVAGEVLAWGDNKWGQLAHYPEYFFDGENVDTIDAGWTHCAVRTTNGNVFLWGRSDYGQLGDLTDEQKNDEDSLKKQRFCSLPARMELKNYVLSVHCGSEHNIVTTIDAEGQTNALVWGWNEHGNCGNGSTTNLYQPTKLAVRGNITRIGVGSGHSFALVKVF